MPEVEIGSEQFTDEDRLYAGSRFREVVGALFANPYQQVWGREGEPPLPVLEQTIGTVFGGLLGIGRPPRVQGAAVRSLAPRPPPRGGGGGKGFPRGFYPNRGGPPRR